MANEATLIVQRTIPIAMTCADGTGITKGAILKLADPFTASTSAAANEVVAGIAYADKIANDGRTKIEVLRGPGDILKVYASGSITAGDPLAVATIGVYTNYVYNAKAGTTLSGSVIIGTALETATAGETFLMELNIVPMIIGVV